MQGCRPRAVHRARHRHRHRVGQLQAPAGAGRHRHRIVRRVEIVPDLTARTRRFRRGLRHQRCARGPQAGHQGGVPRCLVAALHRPPDAQRRRKRQHQAEEDRRAGHTEGRLRGTRPGAGAQLYQLAIGQIEGFCPAAAKLLEEAEADALAYLDFPYEHPVRLRTNNVQERANRELKRRSRVVQVFPSRKSLIRMMGAVFSEMDEDWVARRWFNDDSIGRAVEGHALE